MEFSINDVYSSNLDEVSLVNVYHIGNALEKMDSFAKSLP